MALTAGRSSAVASRTITLTRATYHARHGTGFNLGGRILLTAPGAARLRPRAVRAGGRPQIPGIQLKTTPRTCARLGQGAPWSGIESAAGAAPEPVDQL